MSSSPPRRASDAACSVPSEASDGPAAPDTLSPVQVDVAVVGARPADAVTTPLLDGTASDGSPTRGPAPIRVIVEGGEGRRGSMGASAPPRPQAAVSDDGSADAAADDDGGGGVGPSGGHPDSPRSLVIQRRESVHASRRSPEADGTGSDGGSGSQGPPSRSSSVQSVGHVDDLVDAAQTLGDTDATPVGAGAALGSSDGAHAEEPQLPFPHGLRERPTLMRAASAPLLAHYHHFLEEAQHFGHEPGDESQPSLRRRLGAVMHSTRVTWAIVILLCVDAAFVATELALEASEPCESGDDDGHGHDEHSEHDAKHYVEQALHTGSLAILSVFMVELLLKLYAAPKPCLHSKAEIFDGVIVVSSFVLQLLFGGEGGSDSVGLIVLLRLWRLTRIAHGLSFAVKVEASKALHKERQRTMASQALLRELQARLGKYEQVTPVVSRRMTVASRPALAMDDDAASV